MGVETASYIHQLNPANPSGADKVQQGDDHIRMVKQALLNTFPNFTGALTATQDDLNKALGSLVPTGMIALWFGADTGVPAGWAICNGGSATRSDGTGTITTPDMRGRVPVGANDSHALGSAFGDESQTVTTLAGGAHSHTGVAAAAGEHSHGTKTGATSLSVAQLPKHSHGNGIVDDNDGPSRFNYGTKNATSVGASIRDGGSVSSPVQGLTEDIGSGSPHDHALSPDGSHTHTLTISGAAEHTHTIAPFSILQPSVALHYIMKI